jgi:uncharacterized protein (DUF1015 family)
MEVRPFKALKFDRSVVGKVGDCISPPYDVIDARMQDDLYRKSPYNIVRIIRGRKQPGDNGTVNEYTRAGKYLEEFIGTGVLREDTGESVYVYVQDFEACGSSYHRVGIVALGRLVQHGKEVQPHERTLDGPKADRLNLMRATAAQMGQIFMLYDDPKKIAEGIAEKAQRNDAEIDFVDNDGVGHRLYTIDGKNEIGAFAAMMADKSCVIADGHHRYETALAYYAETRNPAAQYQMMTFVNMRDSGLVILPTHRLVDGLDEFNIDNLIDRIKDTFDVTEFSFSTDAEKATRRTEMFDLTAESFRSRQNAFGIYAGAGSFYGIVLKDSAAMDSACEKMSRAARGLDVNVLHHLILEGVLGIGESELSSESHIEYIKDIGDSVDESISRVDSGSSQEVFFMNPTRIEQVKTLAGAGEKMPQKSTFFYPKVFTGLVMRKLPPVNVQERMVPTVA